MAGRGRATRRGAAILLVLLGAAGPPAAAQSVTLEIRPRVGDTLRMRLDQRVEMTGTAQMNGADSTVTTTTVMRVFAHSIVKLADESGTTMLAVTDSVAMTDSAGRPLPAAEQARRRLQGTPVSLHVAPDGGTKVVEAAGSAVAPELRGLFAQMPATLPRAAVSVGDVWSRTMDIPGGGPGGRRVGTMAATFRLDSLTRGGDVAHISMRGSLSRDGAGEAPEGVKVVQTGIVAGTMAIDRRRGWMTDVRTTLTVHSVLTRPGGRGGAPMKVRMKVTQWLRAM
jgi:hypothetical protein